MENDAQRVIRLTEQYRCEKIVLNLLKRYPDDLVKQRLLKGILSRIRKKENANDR